MSVKTQLVVRHAEKRRFLALVRPMSQNLLANGLLRQLENPTAFEAPKLGWLAESAGPRRTH